VPFIQEGSWIVVGYPNLYLQVHVKLFPKAGDGSSARWSSSYRLIVVLMAEPSVTQVVLDKNEAINHRRMQQAKFVESKFH
jgi:hypothetical protein